MGYTSEMSGRTNGTSPLMTKMNGQSTGNAPGTRRNKRRTGEKRSRGVVAWTLDKALKITVWYSIITLAFRCPKTPVLLTDESPRICKLVVAAKEAVHPYIYPYYESYVAPSVEKAQPYWDVANERAFQPGRAFYDQYGAPRVQQAQVVAGQQWVKTIKPQLEVARKQAGKQYSTALGPHVAKVQNAVDPYYRQVRASANDMWELQVQPIYQTTAPYAQKIYVQGQDFALHTAVPHAQYAGSALSSLWIRQVWPRIRLLYGENVEPQLNRITQRLGRYKDGKKLPTRFKGESQSLADDATAVAESISSLSSVAADPSGTSSTEPSSTVSPKERFHDDLRSWEADCAKAVDEGAGHLKERIQEISLNHISTQGDGVGRSLLVKLEETADSSVQNVQSRIRSVVSSLSEAPADEEFDQAHQGLAQTIRHAGQNIKTRAQAVRDWHNAYNAELDNLVDDALQSALETIDGIRELRLTEIGRRYADQDLPHKEWSRYNDLKKATPTWRDGISKEATDHSAVAEAKAKGDLVLERGMAVTEKAAKELGRLKDVAKWKVEATDSSDDFETRVMPDRIERVQKEVAGKAEGARQAVMGSSQDTAESATSIAAKSAQSVAKAASKSAKSVANKASVDNGPSSVASAKHSVVSAASNKAASSGHAPPGEASENANTIDQPTHDEADHAAAKSSSRVFGGANAQVLVSASSGPILDDQIDDEVAHSERLQHMVDIALDQANSLTRVVADALKGSTTTQGAVESATSVASEQYESALAAASSVLFGSQKGTVERGTDVARQQYASAVTAASYALYGSPTAQYLAAVTSVGNAARSCYSDAVAQASSSLDAAKSSVSQQISGKPKPAHEQLLAAAESSYSGSIAEASARLNDALARGQAAYHSASAMAESRLSEGLRAASQRLQQAKTVVSAEPTPAHQAYLGAAQRAYYEQVGLAHDRYSSFLDAASSAAGATPTTGFAGFMASAQSSYSSALAVASLNVQNARASASSVVGATTQAPSEKYLNEVSAQYDAVAAAASSKLAAAQAQASSMASEAIYGTPQPVTESVASRASENWEALISQASAKVYGEPAPFTDAVVQQAGEYAAQATQVAANQYAAVSALFAEIVQGKEPDFTESVMKRLSSAYSTGVPDMAASVNSFARDSYASATSVVSAIFTPPATLEDFVDRVQRELNSAVDAASAATHGTTKGTIQQASEAIENAASQASEALYGHETGFAEAIQSSLSSIAELASASLSVAVYGTTATGAPDVAASVYSSLTAAAASQAAAASASVSKAIYGEEQSYVESMQSEVAAAMTSAQSRIAALGAQASKTVAGQMSQATEAILEAASSVSSAAVRPKDEL